jgi:hypothetical protein
VSRQFGDWAGAKASNAAAIVWLFGNLAGTQSLELAGVAYGEQDARRATLAI